MEAGPAPLELEPDRSTRELGRVIAARAHEIERRWLERVLKDIATRHDVELTHLRDGIPDYLAALARLMSTPHTEPRGAESWAKVARDHAITRVRVGFDIDQLVREFIALRSVIEEVAREELVLTPEQCTSLADLVEAAIARSVAAYVDAREYEARRRQAESVAFMIHELRNPLSGATLAAGLARAHAVPAQARHLDTLDRSLHRLTELIDSVLLTEKLEAGRAELRWEDVRVGELLDASTVAASEVAADKGLVFDVRAERDASMRIDRDLTRSALQNLVDNAVKYTDHGRVEVTVEDRDTEWSIHVRDTCPGLSPEELRTIFEPFRRGATTKQGTGLGLAIARRAIEAQGGSIHAESRGPTGCHFWFTLPKH